MNIGRSIKVIAVAGFGAMMVLGANTALAKSCPKMAKTKITVNLLNPPAKLQHANTITEINRMFGVRAKSVGGGLNGWHAPGGPNSVIRGLTRAKLGGNFSFAPYWVKSSGTFCYSAKELTLNFGYVEHAVFIPRIYAPSSCEYKVVYAHERTHVQINRKAMEKFGATLKQRLETKLAKSGVAVVRQQSQGVQAYRDLVNAVLRELIQEMYLFSIPLHDKIDTPTNYQLEDAKCTKWVKDVR
ncbi:hypothetical protein [Magnetovibrio sp.]|uniref:hypothetical protein n=1 Tax=Magnetovibrio sp. TaxID=2024836 RepID=UPI002F932986